MTSLVRGAWDSFKRLLGAAWSTPAVRRGIVILLLIDVLWMLWFAVARTLYITEIDPSWYAMRKLRITADGSIPEWINYAKTLVIVALLGGLLVRTRQWIYGALALLFAVVLADDSLAIHEDMGSYFVDLLDIPRRILGMRGQDIGELITWALIGAIVAPLLLIGIWRTSTEHRQEGLAFLIPFAGLLFSAVFVDQLYLSGSKLFPGSGILLDVIEDGGEMIALTITLAMAVGAYRGRPSGSLTSQKLSSS